VATGGAGRHTGARDHVTVGRRTPEAAATHRKETQTSANARKKKVKKRGEKMDEKTDDTARLKHTRRFLGSFVAVRGEKSEKKESL